MIDLRSDTSSRPTPEMRAAMAEAQVGDDVYGDDPTVRALEQATAKLLGKEDAVYVPSGTMSNQIALRTHTEPGDTVLVEGGAHIYLFEVGGAGALAGVLTRVLPGERGIFTPEAVEAAAARLHPFYPEAIRSPAKLLCVENTHNAGGGSIWPLTQSNAVAAAGRALGLAAHLDGARLWNATAATGIAEADYAAPFDTVSVCFSKALGAPVGSCLAGSAALIARARRFKQQYGGGMRQAGIIAAGALYALTHHRPRMGEANARARRFAQGLAQLDGVLIDPESVETNIVRFRLNGVAAGAFAEEARRRGLQVLPSGPDAIRAVFYLDIDEAAGERAVGIVAETLRALS